MTRRAAVLRHDRYPDEPHLRRSVHALRDAGFLVDVICDREPGLPRYQRLGGITVYRLLFPHRRSSVIRYLFEYLTLPLLAAAILAALTLAHRYDDVEIDNPPDWLVLAGLAPRLRGARVILYMFENMPEIMTSDHGLPEDSLLMRCLLAVQRLCTRMADVVIAPHEMARRILIEQGVEAARIGAVVPNVPNEEIFLAEVSPKEPGRAVQDRAFRLVTHGTLLERYGIQTLLEAMALLRDRIPELRLEIIGNGEYRPQLEALSKRLGLEAQVTFTPRVPFERLASYLVRADLGIVPMWAPFVPNKLMEYLALRLPVVITDWPSVRLYFGDDAVRFVEPRSAAALADAILELYRHPERRAALAARGHEVYRRTLAWERSKSRYLGVYQSARAAASLLAEGAAVKG